MLGRPAVLLETSGPPPHRLENGFLSQAPLQNGKHELVARAIDGGVVQRFDVVGSLDYLTYSTAASADGRYVAAGTAAACSVFDVRSGATLASLSHEESVDVLAFSPDGQSVACASVGRLAVLSVGGAVREARLDDGVYVDGLCFGADGGLLASVRTALWRFDATSLAQTARVDVDMRRRGLFPLPGGRALAFVIGGARVLDAVTLGTLQETRLQRGYVAAAAVDARGAHAAVLLGPDTAMGDPSVCSLELWSLDEAPRQKAQVQIDDVPATMAGLGGVAFTEDGILVVTARRTWLVSR